MGKADVTPEEHWRFWRALCPRLPTPRFRCTACGHEGSSRIQLFLRRLACDRCGGGQLIPEARRRRVKRPLPALRAYRLLANKSQARLAREVGITPGALCHLETGRRAPYAATLEHLAAALGVSAELLQGPPPSAPPPVKSSLLTERLTASVRALAAKYGVHEGTIRRRLTAARRTLLS